MSCFPDKKIESASHELRTPTRHNLPPVLRRAAEYVGRTLDEAGFRSWLVGGCVRDLALGSEPHDVDMVTDALPEQIEALFDRTHAVGRAFGTVRVLLPRQVAGEVKNLEIEVTTLRAEGEYLDGRHPTQVAFTDDALEDSRRRDFTCNALYLDAASDELFDPHRGLDDLAGGWLRTVGPPADRFAEDGLRLWRMARFAAQLHLRPAPGLLRAAREQRGTLVGVSPERVWNELLRILSGPGPRTGATMLEACRLWPDAWAEFRSGVPNALYRNRIRKLPEHAARNGKGLLELAFLLAPYRAGHPWGPWTDLGLPRAALEWLRPSRTQLQTVAELWDAVGALPEVRSDPRPRIRRRWAQREVAGEALVLAAQLHGAMEGPAEDLEWLSALGSWIEGLPHDERYPTLYLQAKDLLEQGMRPGPRIGALLKEAEGLQLDGEWTSREEALGWLSQEAMRE